MQAGFQMLGKTISFTRLSLQDFGINIFNMYSTGYTFSATNFYIKKNIAESAAKFINLIV